MNLLGRVISAYVKHGPAKGKARVVKILLPLAGEAPVRSQYGVLVAPNPNDITSAWSISGGVYDDVREALSALTDGMVFVDIGANVGVFSMLASKIVGSDGLVIAFEPSPKVFERLVASAKANKLTNFFPFQLALAATTKLAHFQSGPSSHSGTGHLADSGDITVLQADFKDIDGLLRPLLSDREIMIKIDVEGGEGLVVRALEPLLRSGRVKAVVVEIDHDYLARFGTRADEIYDVMRGAGLAPTKNLAGDPDHYNEIFILRK